MALINGAIQIGRSAIVASQAALAVAGNNIANAATPSYSRQTVHLTPTQYTEVIPGKYTGTGVAMYDIRRQVDDALNGRIRTAVGDSASNYVLQQAMARIEASFNELTDQDLSSRLSAFFGAWSALQNKPQDVASRSVVLQEGASLANFIGRIRSELTSIQSDLDAQIRFQVTEADALADQIADLNEQVVTAEAGRAGSAAALRDQRDELLKQLAELVNITTREVEGGSINVFIGNDPIIQYSDNRGLAYMERQDAAGQRLAQVVFSDDNLGIDMTSGKIHGLITARDNQLGGIISDLSNWTKSLIYEVNSLHSTGRGLEGLTSVAATHIVDDPDASLASTTDTNLPWSVTNGGFYINVVEDGSEQPDQRWIKVDIGMGSPDTTLNDLADAINAAAVNVAASVTGGRLQIDADAGFSFGFSAPDDGSATNVLAVLGINSFFDGSGANDIAVSTSLTENTIAVSANGLPGDGTIAEQISQLAMAPVSSLGGLSLTENFNSMIGTIAADAKAARDNYIAADVVVQTLENERQGISGVSIDEEAIHLITYQRAFQGAARYISLIDEMLDEVMALAR